MNLYNFYTKLNPEEAGTFRYLLREILDPQTSDGPAIKDQGAYMMYQMLSATPEAHLIHLTFKLLDHVDSDVEKACDWKDERLKGAAETIRELQTENGILKGEIEKLKKRIETGNKLLKSGPAPSKDQIKEIMRRGGVITDQTDQIICPECGSKRWGAYTTCPNQACPSNKRYRMHYKMPPQVGNGVHELPTVVAFTFSEHQNGE